MNLGDKIKNNTQKKAISTHICSNEQDIDFIF